MFKLKKFILYGVFISIGFVSNLNTIIATEKKDAPLNIAGVKKVVAEDIFTLIDEIPDLTIIDARMRTDRIQGYIEGSISLPDIETDCNSLKKNCLQ